MPRMCMVRCSGSENDLAFPSSWKAYHGAISAAPDHQMPMSFVNGIASVDDGDCPFQRWSHYVPCLPVSYSDLARVADTRGGRTLTICVVQLPASEQLI